MKSIKDLLNESSSDKQSLHRYGFIYDLLLNKVYQEKGIPLKVLEIGVSMYGSGSFRALAQSDIVGRIVGVDIQPYDESDMLDNMRFILMDAYHMHNVSKLKEEEGLFDIIIDDAIHEYGSQNLVIDNYQDLLSDVGLLITEDVTSLRLINEHCEKPNTFLFDGWGNLELGIKSFEDKKLYHHNERILVTSKSESLTDYATHDSKPHIPRLPDVKFKDYESNSTELAVSIPLYHADLNNESLYNKEKFQDVFCRGAIWSGISFIHNTDLGDNGVPLYFHVETEVWEDAKPVFDQFEVPNERIKVLTLPRKTSDVNVGPNKDVSGKIAMGLMDDSIDPDTLLILDGDLFTCAAGDKIKLFDKLTSPILKRQPSMTYFRHRQMDYGFWVSAVASAADLNPEIFKEKSLNEIEKIAYETLGFERDLEEDLKWNDTVPRFYCENYLHTFPRGHQVIDFAKKFMAVNRCYPYAFGIWAEYNNPLLELDNIINIPTYDWEQDYINAKDVSSYFAHIRVSRNRSKKFQSPSLISQYWDRFIADVSRHIS